DVLKRGRWRVAPQAMFRLGSSQLRRHEHRHPIAALARKRNAHQNIVDLAVRHVHRPDAETRRKRPRHLDVAEHVLLHETPALEPNPKFVPRDRMSAVAADHKAGTYLLFAIARGQRGG